MRAAKAGRTQGQCADGTRLEGDSREGTAGNRGAGLVFEKSGMAPPATLSLTRAPVDLTTGALRSHASRVICHGVRSRFSTRTSARIHSYNELTSPMSAS